MVFEVVVCAFIGIIAVLAILTLWRKKYSQFVPDDKHSIFQVLLDAIDSILFVISGNQNALHLSTAPSGKSEGSCSLPCFQSSMLKGIHHCLQRACAEIGRVSSRGNGKEFTCVERPLSLCSLDIVCESILGVKIGALRSEAEEYVHSLHRLSDLLMSRMWKFWQWTDFIFHYLKAYREILQHLRVAHGFSRSIIKERKLRYMIEEMGVVSRRPKCLLDVLLKLHIEDQVLGEEGVRQEVDTFISAVQEKIHQELDSVLGVDSKGPLSVADLNELTYLDCVLKECNRLYTPVPIIARKVSEETTICGYTIPKRTTFIVAPFFVHRDEDVFPDPEKFDPERFLPENSARIPDCGYIPFVVGPRNCIGRVFGELEVKVLVCHILRNFSLHSLDSRDQVLPIIKLSLQSSQPARIKFRRRQQ
ncbi:cytochrome P450 4V2 [Caerostris darwini]|uniref:Cytochrome P450 4V2 n=1 Tax=Caerostris darwini TaxID=1538125 RepID=A0AAV4SZU0_9ARAC|nr:cytochrome P450 4V2 [Caerostris darwini]